jgi:hypothetical protein
MKGSIAVAIPLWLMLLVGVYFLYTRVLRKA